MTAKNAPQSDYPENWIKEGPWVKEAHIQRHLWRDEKTGLACFIERNWLGAWCGFVLFQEPSPFVESFILYGPPCESEVITEEQEASNRISKKLSKVKVHGGITFSDYIEISPELMESIGGGEYMYLSDKPLWSVGFSCLGPNDACPHLMFTWRNNLVGCTYRDFDFAVKETESLASQLSALK